MRSITAAVGIGVAVGTKSTNSAADITSNVLGGVAVGLLLTGVLGVLAMTNEYTSGTIRASMAAIPNRPLLLAGKAFVFAVASLVVGEIASFTAFFAGTAALPNSIPAPSLSTGAVLRAVVLSGTGFCLIGLIGLGLGAIIRHTPAAVVVLVGGVYVGAQIVGAVSRTALAYIPVSLVANSLSTVHRLPRALPPWAGLGMLCLYAAVALGVGGWLLLWRDA